MTAYKYRGYDSRGQSVTGEVTANTVEEVELKLASSEVTVISIVPLLLKEKGKTESAGGKKKSPNLLATSIGANGSRSTRSRQFSETWQSWPRPACR